MALRPRGLRPLGSAASVPRRAAATLCFRASNSSAPSVSAGTVEHLVLEQLRQLDPEGFSALWLRQAPDEQARLIQRLVERVDYDRVQGKLAITLQADHLTVLGEAQARAAKETNP